jgi:protoporphyrin/coproporphyrin ferrochelatase
MICELIVERTAGAAARPVVGRLGPCPDVCPPDCCPARKG